MDPLRIIISGGGTGGHIFPAISIADAVRAQRPDAEILFVGAEGRMEMHRVPDAGYEIKGLPVAGIDRRRPWRNVAVAVKFWKSLRMARRIIKDFKPQVVVGVGGYASGPTLNAAQHMGIPTLIQEQNSYAGVTNKFLSRKARRFCVAYDGMERFFPADRILFTGNPVRQTLLDTSLTPQEARRSLGLKEDIPTVLIIGGSLGARTLNESILSHLDLIRQHTDVQFLWQTGKYYSRHIADELDRQTCPENLHAVDFVADMAAAYAAASLVVSRAGASSVSELCLLAKPAILVPSPNVAEDHQTKNALALVEKEAAIYVSDAEAPQKLLPLALDVVADAKRLASLSESIKKLARPDAAATIAAEVVRLAGEKGKREQ